MQQKKFALKVRFQREGIYEIIEKRIISCKRENENVIPFPRIFSKLCSSLQISKKQCWELLYFLTDMQKIRIICGHGIQINQGIINNA